MYRRDFVLWTARRAYNDLVGQRINTAKLNWFAYNVGRYGIIQQLYVLRGSSPFVYCIGYLVTLVPVG